MATCNRCPDEESQFQLLTEGGGYEPLGLACYFKAMNPEGHAAPVPPPTPKLKPWEYATLDEAAARASKVEFYLHDCPEVWRRGEGCYALSFDSPLVPGFKGENPYK